MKERIAQIIQKEDMTAAQFAEKIGISPSSLSHILSGRNNPSLEVVMKIHKACDYISLDWLLYGEGQMETDVDSDNNIHYTPSLFDENSLFTPERPASPEYRKENEVKTPLYSPKEIVREEIKYVEVPAKKITEIRIFFDNGIFEHFLDDWDFMNNHSLTISDNYFLNQFDNIVFEAAQGLLLDQNNTEYFPHLTPSNTGIENPKRIIENVEWNDEINIETCYVSRTYLTRHGAGKFPSECNKRFINEYMFDKTNVPNPFQDTLRYGTLDLRELYSRCSDDVGNFGDEKSIAITHCNEYDWDNDKLIELFKDWNIYYSDGETHNDVN